MGAGKPITIGGIAIPFNVENKNGRIYTEESFSEECLEDMKDAINKGEFLGEIMNSQQELDPYGVNLARVSHRITKADIKEKGLYVEVEVLDGTPNGYKVKKMMDDIKLSAKLPFSIASRGIGKVNENKEVELERIESFDLILRENSSFDEDFTRLIKNEED